MLLKGSLTTLVYGDGWMDGGEAKSKGSLDGNKPEVGKMWPTGCIWPTREFCPAFLTQPNY